MKGVILAGGTGKRMRPLSEITNKHLLPICNKPMICYPLETLLKIDITKILIITGEKHLGDFFSLLGTGKDCGFMLSYASQQEPLGTAAALLLAEDFVGDEEFIVILGDNIVSEDITKFVRDFHNEKMRFKAKILVSKKKNPHEYGVIVFQGGNIADIIEKPAHPPTHFVNTGIWMLVPEVFDRLRNVEKSPRGEYEMTDVLAAYAREGLLTYSLLKSTWLDVGTLESFNQANLLLERTNGRGIKEEARFC